MHQRKIALRRLNDTVGVRTEIRRREALTGCVSVPLEALAGNADYSWRRGCGCGRVSLRLFVDVRMTDQRMRRKGTKS